MEISYSESRPDLENVSLIVSIARLRVVFASNSADRPRRSCKPFAVKPESFNEAPLHDTRRLRGLYG